MVRGAENIEVRGSHLGLGHNPPVLVVVADRLAQPIGQWKPYRALRVDGDRSARPDGTVITVTSRTDVDFE